MQSLVDIRLLVSEHKTFERLSKYVHYVAIERKQGIKKRELELRQKTEDIYFFQYIKPRK